MEKLGKPTVLVVAKGFELDAKLNARVEGVPDLSLAMFPLSAVPTLKEIEELKLGEKVANEVAEALTQRLPHVSDVKEAVEGKVPEFHGNDYAGALNNMEKYFLQQGWSDGFPIVPPTEAAVREMLEGTDLPRNHVVGKVEPEGGKATVEKIAINAVMAGCRPQYLPVIIAAVEALTDATFDLRGGAVYCRSRITSTDSQRTKTD
ncbi:hypothetical protein ACFLXT_03570 [Chloroflexota bacterium]